MRSDLDAGGQRLDLRDDAGQVLQHEAAGQVGQLALQLREVVARAAAHVYDGHLPRTRPDAARQPLAHRIESGVHPVRPIPAVPGHVVVEGLLERRARALPLPGVQLGALAVLEGPGCGGVGIGVRGVGEEVRELLEHGAGHFGAGACQRDVGPHVTERDVPGRDRIAVYGHGERARQFGGPIAVHVYFVDDLH